MVCTNFFLLDKMIFISWKTVFRQLVTVVSFDMASVVKWNLFRYFKNLIIKI